ncbi:MAG: (d)CMP kinase [Rhodobacteraceae bacterium]|jgi:cytidylate kinase|nr:(d)CMP kinase [Paracoccaceae bacterium]
MSFVVAIDGPAAAGKGTLARALAAHFGFQYLDTGLLYRAVGAKVADGHEPLTAAQNLAVEDLARSDLRSVEAGQHASKVAVIPEVRSALLDFQRAFADRDGGAVLDGRDIGTVICPNANLKLYVTARAEVRAKRRWDELEQSESYDAILAAVIERDERDMNRADAPLKPAADAHILDTSDLSIKDVLQTAITLVNAAR